MVERDVFRRKENAVAHLLGSVNPGIDRRNHSDKNTLRWLQILLDDVQYIDGVPFSREGDVEIAGLKFEKAREQLGVIHARAVSGVPVSSRAGMHPYSLALLGSEPGKCEIVQIDEPAEQLARGIDFN